MPFTFNGDWIPSKPEPSQEKPVKGPVKIYLEKRKKALITVISNLPMNPVALKALASDLKKTLGCGGSVKKNTIEIQGDHQEKIKEFLQKKNIKAQCRSKKRI